MVQLAMLITGIAVGMKAMSWHQAVTITLVVFAATLAIQTPFLMSDSGTGSAFDLTLYVVIQVASLAVAFAIERLCLSRRQRRGVAA